MRSMRRVTIGMAGMLMVTIPGCDLLSTGTSRQGILAAERKVVVMLDATGSMTALRVGDLEFPNRFEAAKGISRDDLVQLAGDASLPLTGVRVFLFHNTGITEQIPPNPDPVTEENPDPDNDGWFATDPVRRMIVALPAPSGLTPLAGSMCDGADQFAGLPADTTKTMATYTDGGENNTNPLHACFSLDTATWQAKVTAHVLNAGVEVHGALFTDVTSFAGPSRPDPETGEVDKNGRAPSLAALTDAEFFKQLSEVTGGTFRLIDDQAPVPVFADVTGDADVDREDAIELARQFGQAADPRFDLNNDGVIDFNDYLIVVSRLGLGGGDPDPFAARDPVNCNTSDRVVIERQVIENASVAIDAHGSCRITIRDSLIVSGANAITTTGAAEVIVENSVIVGQDNLIKMRGVVRLSATGSILHGRTNVRGRLKIDDRGGNVFE